jgi:CheY-like chemotaxis protein
MKSGLPFTILLVEDDPDDRMIIDEAFMEIGYQAEVKKFIGSKGLLHYLEQVEPPLYPNLIVLDNNLPEMDAQEVLSRLKQNPSYKHIPVVVYTTSLSPARKEQLLAAGAYACFEKGNNMNEVVQLAKELKHLAESRSNSLK